MYFLLEKTPEYNFKQNGQESIKMLNALNFRQLKKEYGKCLVEKENKEKEMEIMIGKRSSDLLFAADTIVQMHNSIKSVQDTLVRLKNGNSEKCIKETSEEKYEMVKKEPISVSLMEILWTYVDHFDVLAGYEYYKNQKPGLAMDRTDRYFPKAFVDCAVFMLKEYSSRENENGLMTMGFYDEAMQVIQMEKKIENGLQYYLDCRCIWWNARYEKDSVSAIRGLLEFIVFTIQHVDLVASKDSGWKHSASREEIVSDIREWMNRLLMVDVNVKNLDVEALQEPAMTQVVMKDGTLLEDISIEEIRHQITNELVLPRWKKLYQMSIGGCTTRFITDVFHEKYDNASDEYRIQLTRILSQWYGKKRQDWIHRILIGAIWRFMHACLGNVKNQHMYSKLSIVTSELCAKEWVELYDLYVMEFRIESSTISTWKTWFDIKCDKSSQIPLSLLQKEETKQYGTSYLTDFNTYLDPPICLTWLEVSFLLHGFISKDSVCRNTIVPVLQDVALYLCHRSLQQPKSVVVQRTNTFMQLANHATNFIFTDNDYPKVHCGYWTRVDEDIEDDLFWLPSSLSSELGTYLYDIHVYYNEQTTSNSISTPFPSSFELILRQCLKNIIMDACSEYYNNLYQACIASKTPVAEGYVLQWLFDLYFLRIAFGVTPIVAFGWGADDLDIQDGKSESCMKLNQVLNSMIENAIDPINWELYGTTLMQHLLMHYQQTKRLYSLLSPNPKYKCADSVANALTDEFRTANKKGMMI